MATPPHSVGDTWVQAQDRISPHVSEEQMLEHLWTVQPARVQEETVAII